MSAFVANPECQVQRIDPMLKPQDIPILLKTHLWQDRQRTATSRCCPARTIGGDTVSDNSIAMLMVVATVLDKLPQPVVE
jgi:hypothetical protein